jgi:hypothetical protein
MASKWTTKKAPLQRNPPLQCDMLNYALPYIAWCRDNLTFQDYCLSECNTKYSCTIAEEGASNSFETLLKIYQPPWHHNPVFFIVITMTT